jgi:hypothetical protein
MTVEAASEMATRLVKSIRSRGTLDGSLDGAVHAVKLLASVASHQKCLDTAVLYANQASECFRG